MRNREENHVQFCKNYIFQIVVCIIYFLVYDNIEKKILLYQHDFCFSINYCCLNDMPAKSFVKSCTLFLTFYYVILMIFLQYFYQKKKIVLFILYWSIKTKVSLKRQQQQENVIKTFSIRLNKPRLVKWERFRFCLYFRDIFHFTFSKWLWYRSNWMVEVTFTQHLYFCH